MTSTVTCPVANEPDRFKIVVGYDGSESARRALESAAALAGDQTLLVVVSVAEPYPRSGITIPANLDRVELQRRRRQLDEARTFLSERGVQVETLQLRGNPAAVLVEAAADADLAVFWEPQVDSAPAGGTRLRQLEGRSQCALRRARRSVTTRLCGASFLEPGRGPVG
jgi:hypothetical protein